MRAFTARWHSRTYLSVCAVLAALWSTPEPALAQGNNPETAAPIRIEANVRDRTKRGVVQVITDNGSGSGFFVTTSPIAYCITNLHVVQSAIRYNDKTDGSNTTQTSKITIRTAFGEERTGWVFKSHRR